MCACRCRVGESFHASCIKLQTLPHQSFTATGIVLYSTTGSMFDMYMNPEVNPIYILNTLFKNDKSFWNHSSVMLTSSESCALLSNLQMIKHSLLLKVIQPFWSLSNSWSGNLMPVSVTALIVKFISLALFTMLQWFKAALREKENAMEENECKEYRQSGPSLWKQC